MNKALEDALDAMLARAFEDGWTDQRMDRAAARLLAKHGKPGETLVWDRAFGGTFKIVLEAKANA